jgi:hypothetical protein
MIGVLAGDPQAISISAAAVIHGVRVGTISITLLLAN